MRNLEILLHASTNLVQLNGDSEEEVACFAVDEFSHRLYVISTQNVLYAFGYAQLLPANTCKLKYQYKLAVKEGAKPVALSYIQELSALVIAYSSGNIFTYSNQTENEGKLATLNPYNIFM